MDMHSIMNLFYRYLAFGFCVALLSSCMTRSISDSDYRHGYRDSASGSYHGEITELDVLGSGTNRTPAEAFSPVGIKRGERLLVIQSGAVLPDEPMLKELERYFSIAAFSGIPSKEADSSYAERLRTAALNGGCTRIFVYWGVLESARREEATKVLSWVPVIGQVVPDSTQTMRIRLKGFLVDAVNGHWTMLMADSFEDQRTSASIVRKSSDQGQVARLKALAYRNLVVRLL
jgi:hypothetical protein